MFSSLSGEPGDVVASKYKVIKPIGNGSHAVVWQGQNIKTGQKVALKQMTFDGESEKVKRTYREVKLLQFFAKHENIVTPFDLVTNDSEDKFDTVFLVMELCTTDLQKLLKSSLVLSITHIKSFTFQLVRAVRALHKACVVHRDLKPQNILISQQTNNHLQIYLCDFGTGRLVQDDPSVLRQTSLNSVTTAFYCAPEGLLSKDIYSNSVDMWAIGCIVAEMIKREPLFQGRNAKHQLELIVDLCGKPSNAELCEFPESSKKKFLMEYSVSTREPIETHFPPGADKEAIDIIEKLLTFNPSKRLTSAEAFLHPFLDPFNRRDTENFCSEPFPDLENSGQKFTPEVWRDLLWDEVGRYQREKEEASLVGPGLNEQNNLWG